MKKYLLIIVVIFLIACQKKPQNSTVYVGNGFAVGGYDVVAFFTENMPVKGTAKYSHKWNDATWLFSSKTNLEDFTADPEKYAPQFGGYCAYGCSDGHKAPTEPETWTIVNGKLYFNYNMDVKALWMENQIELIEKANKNWPKIMYE